MDSIMEPNKAAHDLAQVRKLIEGMNALVNSQSHLQQQKSEPEEPVPVVSHESTPNINQSTTAMTDTSNSLYNMSQLTTPLNAIIVEVNHLVFNRTLFFSLTRKFLHARHARHLHHHASFVPVVVCILTLEYS
jgi:beta-N-acetylglucosaminidase